MSVRFPPPGARRTSSLLAALAVGAAAGLACADLVTSPVPDSELFDAPLPGLTASELAAFVRGDEEFSRRFSPATGLGPIFNNASCFSCHSGDGRGRLENALRRVGTPDDEFLASLGGPQIQDKAISGAEAERVPEGVPVSVRLPPPVFGVGLIEAIPDSVILAGADPDDADGDGISGRPNWVTTAAFVPPTEPGGDGQPRIGRFGRKGQVSSLFQQTVEAYHQDIGITSEFLPAEPRNPLASVPTDAVDVVPDPEITTSVILAVVHYIRTLAPSGPGAMTDRRREGQALFQSVGCAQCHTPTLRTGAHRIAAVANRDVELFSDLLLHDMGDALADNRPDGQASGREWKTPPLWGLRLMRQFLNGDAFLLHDGRARTVEEAIRLHDGEARRARDAFAALTAEQRRALLDFVESR